MLTVVCLSGCLAAMTAGCAANRPSPRVAPPIAASGAGIARTAESMVGAPYRNGGSMPDGFDCSGLVTYAFARAGMHVPRDTYRQALTGLEVPRRHIRAGDLVFFTTTGPGPTHVGIALDAERFVHAPKTGAVVRVESLRSTYWSQRFLFARRLTF
jgi:cell wall-associated NlpC family hydrolase